MTSVALLPNLPFSIVSSLHELTTVHSLVLNGFQISFKPSSPWCSCTIIGRLFPPSQPQSMPQSYTDFIYQPHLKPFMPITLCLCHLPAYLVISSLPPPSQSSSFKNDMELDGFVFPWYCPPRISLMSWMCLQCRVSILIGSLSLLPLLFLVSYGNSWGMWLSHY